jgi:hypothetical protein
MNGPDIGLDTLLDLDGSILEQEGGYWIKIEVRRIPPSEHARHGIRYSLTLHDKYGNRVLGFDNAHAVKPPKKFKSPGNACLTTIVTGPRVTKACPTRSSRRIGCWRTSSQRWIA